MAHGAVKCLLKMVMGKPAVRAPFAGPLRLATCFIDIHPQNPSLPVRPIGVLSGDVAAYCPRSVGDGIGADGGGWWLGGHRVQRGRVYAIMG